MERIRVSSESIRSIGYEAGIQTLEIEFIHGGIYQYYSVPQSIYDQMMTAESKGKYFHIHINRIYPFSRM